MDKEFNLVTAVRIVLKWKTPILVLILVAGVAAGLFSVFVMDEYFLSWSTVYPTNQYANDRNVIFNSLSSSGQVEYFGSKGDVNRVLSIANSEPVIDYLIDSFKLVEHYKISKNSAYWKTKVRKKFDKNYEAIKTEHDAVQVSMYDTDPKMASDMVNAAIEKVDELNKSHVNDTKKNLYDLISTQILEQQRNVNTYADTLAALANQYKIKVSSGAPGTTIVDGNDVKAVQHYKTLLAKQENAEKELNNRVNIQQQMEVALKSNSSSLFIVEKASPADRREKPVRSLVVLITMLVTGFISIIGVMLIEQIRELKAQL
jgi:capsular polysaccharide biosynthesis protein